jgi:hypothetical protein
MFNREGPIMTSTTKRPFPNELGTHRSLVNALLVNALFAFFVVAPHAMAEGKKIVKWTDEKGVVHFGDSQPASQANRGSQTLNQSGVVVANKADQKTATANAEAKVLAEQQRIAAEKRKLEDQRMLDSYASETDIMRDYQQNTELLDQQIKSTQQDIDARQKSLAKLIATAGENERAGKPVPEPIKVMIASERAQIERQKKYITERQSSRTVAKTKYDETLKRYREVMARTKK